MAPVRMYVAKFGREVLIDEDHPLAIAQRAADQANQASEAKQDDTVQHTVQDGALGAALVPDSSSGELEQDGRHPVEPPAPLAETPIDAPRRRRGKAP